jgi:hypothetical protein
MQAMSRESAREVDPIRIGRPPKSISDFGQWPPVRRRNRNPQSEIRNSYIPHGTNYRTVINGKARASGKCRIARPRPPISWPRRVAPAVRHDRPDASGDVTSQRETRRFCYFLSYLDDSKQFDPFCGHD